MQNQNICSKCQGSVHFFEIAASKKGKNPCKTKIFFQSVRVLGLFLNLPLFTFARTLHENQAGFVTWPSKVARPLDRCQRVEGKISLILSDLEVTVLNQIPQKFNFCKFSYYVLYCNGSNKSCIFLTPGVKAYTCIVLTFGILVRLYWH